MPSAGATPAQLAEAMVGQRVVKPVRSRSRATRDLEESVRSHEAVCELRDATVRGDGAWPLLDRVTLGLQRGEVLAIAGVAGNGQAALAEVLCGQRPLDAGQVLLQGAPMPRGPRAVVRAGVARIPEDRHAVGAVGDLALWENAVLEQYAETAFARAGFVRRAAARAYAQDLVTRFDVRGTEGAGLDTVTRQLSGGNMQKLILGRALLHPDSLPDKPVTPRLIVAHQPTWGLDIGAVAYVQEQLIAARDAGAAVLLISDDLDEVLVLGDQVAVIHAGHLGAPRPAADWSREAIGLAMAGAAEPGA
jgi:simple sugar transport system ATP-binding protein